MSELNGARREIVWRGVPALYRYDEELLMAKLARAEPASEALAQIDFIHECKAYLDAQFVPNPERAAHDPSANTNL